jgi:hypothetical protein
VLRRPLAAAVGGAIAFCALAPTAPPGGAAAASDCSGTAGVTVIVDFTHFGGAIERGCEPGTPADALDAVHDAGFTTAGTARYGDAFVCRIDSLPSPKAEACTDTPPAQASWSFYFARPTDRTWTYSTVGVLTYQPAPGTLLAFAFGNVAKPGVLPSGAAVTTTTKVTTPRTTPRQPPTTGPPVSRQAGGSAPPAPLAVTTLPAPRRATESTAPPTTAARLTRPVAHRASTSTTSATPRVVDKTAAGPAPHDNSGTPVPALLTVALVAVLGVGAFAAAATRRRRSA